MNKRVVVLLLCLIIMELLLESAECKSLRSKKGKRSRTKSKSKSKRRRPAEYIDVGVGHPDSGLRRAFLRFLKDSLRKLERSDSVDKSQVKLAVGVPLGLVTAYGIYADYCDVYGPKHPLCNLPQVLAPKITAVTQRLFGFNLFQRFRNYFH